MFSLKEMPSTSTVLSVYASLATSLMFVRSITNEFIPCELQRFLLSKFRHLFTPFSSQLILIIEEFDGLSKNQIYEASEVFLRCKITPSIQRLRINKSPREKNISVTIEKGEEINDEFEGIQLRWKLNSSEILQTFNQDDYRYPTQQRSERRFFELSFHRKHRDKVLDSYLPYILDRAKILKEENKVVKLHTFGTFYGEINGGVWGTINLEHPATFDTLAMDPEVKKNLMEDLKRFVERKEFYRRVGKAWKRGYLLYGPPGTGKSSLIAAMANYLKFDVYDLELSNFYRDDELRKVLVSTTNRSIIVIEDIDCSVDLQDRQGEDGGHLGRDQEKLTLSGLLNFIDGLWSSCGDERIIVFTTNHKDRLDPALLRPGRMDMHIHMSYCTPHGFKILANNYLGLQNNHQFFEEIENLIENALVTPAEVAEELMKSDKADVALGGLVKFLKRKMEEHEHKDEEEDEVEYQQPKMQKIDNGEEKKMVRRTNGRWVGRGRRNLPVRVIY